MNKKNIRKINFIFTLISILIALYIIAHGIVYLYAGKVGKGFLFFILGLSSLYFNDKNLKMYGILKDKN